MAIEIDCKFVINIINNVIGNLDAFWLVLEEVSLSSSESLEAAMLLVGNEIMV